MIAQLIVFLTLAIASLIYLRFAYIDRKGQQAHLHQMTVLINRFTQHKAQISNRGQALDAYRFQEYNLDEALQPQWEISLDDVN